jgi:transcriptional regulator with XRE-family HTH domain
MTQEQLAEASGFSQQHLSDLERGRRNPTVLTLFELAEALGISHVMLVKPDREFTAREKG